jgi:fibronectin-binding autotransporter adhesin
LILTGLNRYTGGTTISAGTLQLGNGGESGSIIGDVANSGSLVFEHSNDLTFNGIVSGSGALEQAGKGTLKLTGTNTYTGNTTVSQGVLQIGNGGTTGSVVGDVTDNATLVFNRSDDVVFSGLVTGSGGLEQQGSGSLLLTGDNTYTGGTKIDHTTTDQSTLQLGNGGTSGSIAGDVVDNGVLVFDRSDDITFHGLISGQGRIVKSGKGTLVLSRVNTYSGGSTVEQGELEILPGTSPGTGAIAVGSASTQYTGQVLKVDAGVALSNYVFLYDGATLDNAGAIHQSVFDATVQSSGSGNVTVVNRDGASIDGSYQGIQLGYGGSISNGAGSVISGFTRGISSDVGGAITVNNSGGSIIGWTAGDLHIGDGISAVSATIINTDGGRIEGRAAGIVVFSDATILNSNGSVISGNGAGTGAGVALFGGGVVTNDGATIEGLGEAIVAYSGTTTISNLNGGMLIGNVDLKADAANVVTLMAGSSIQGNLSLGTNPQATLTLNGDNALPQSYSDAVSGTTTFAGALIKEGTGSWNIDTGDLSGVIETDVNNGALHSNTVLAGMVNVAAQGTLDGGPGVSGTLSNAGKVAVHDGDSAIGGNYVQSSTGTLAISLGSKLNVAGTATLNGGTLEITGADSGYVSNTHTNVLAAAGGVSGTFDQLVKDTGVVFTATTINYDANSVWLDTTGLDVTTAAAGDGVSYTPASFGSARRVQGAFEQLDDKIATGDLADVPGDFLQAAGQFQRAPTLQAAQASLQSLSGQLHAASAAMTFETIGASSRALSDRFDNLLDKGTGFGMWTHDLGMGGDMARAGFSDVGFQLNGWLVGNDRQIGRSGVAGYAFGQSQGQQRLHQGYDHDRSRSTEGMLYAAWLDGNWYTQGRVGFGHFQQDTTRQILLGEGTQGVGTQYGGNYDVAHGESGLRFQHGNTNVTPFANVEYARIGRDGFAEQGAGGFGLRSNAQSLDRWQAGLGVRAGRHWDLDGGRTVDFSARAQWERTLASHGDEFNASFVGLQQWQPLVGIGLSRYSGEFDAALDARLSAHTSLKFDYDYEMGQRDHAQMLSANLNMTF